MIGRQGIYANVAVLLALTVIVFATVSIGGLATRSARFENFRFILPWGPTSETDLFHNTLLYLPLGAALAAKAAAAGRSGAAVYGFVLAACFGLSYLLESVQLLTPGRKPALADVAANCAGGAVGAFAFAVVHRRNLFYWTAAYVAGLLAMAVPLQRAVTFSNWDTNAYLAFGNEPAGGRAWSGTLSEVLIANQPLATAEAENLLQKRTQLESPVIARYSLPDHTGCDEAAMELRTVGDRGQPCSHLGPSRYLVGDAVGINRELSATSRLSLFVVARPSRVEQGGPARIVTLSKNSDQRNFTLGQEASSLVFRLRTGLTGENGVRPELVVPGVFSDLQAHNILVTYDGARLNAWVDGRKSDRSLELSPGAVLASYFVALRPEWMWLYKVLFYGIAFGLLAVLLLLNRRAGLFAASLAIATAAAFALELMLVTVSGRPLQMQNIALSLAVLLAPLMMISHFPATPQPSGEES